MRLHARVGQLMQRAGLGDAGIAIGTPRGLLLPLAVEWDPVFRHSVDP